MNPDGLCLCLLSRLLLSRGSTHRLWRLGIGRWFLGCRFRRHGWLFTRSRFVGFKPPRELRGRTGPELIQVNLNGLCVKFASLLIVLALDIQLRSQFETVDVELDVSAGILELHRDFIVAN